MFSDIANLLVTNELVVNVTLRPKGAAPGGSGVAPPPAPGGSGVTPTPPPPLTGAYDPAVPSLLLSGYNNRLDAIGDPDLVRLAPLGFPFAYMAPVDGFARTNSCYKWEGALRAPVDGKYTFAAAVKSGGYIVFDNDLKWEQDREDDPGSHAVARPTFDVTLKAGQYYDVKAELVEQGGEHVFELKWLRPDAGSGVAPQSIPALLCAPPADWQKRLKAYAPPPPPPPPPGTTPDVPPQPDFATYQTPDLPAGAMFPADNPWNTKVSGLPADKNSAAIIASLGTAHLHPGFGKVYNGGPNGIPVQIVPAGTPKVAVKFEVADESDAGPWPIPAQPVLENAGQIDGGNNDVHWIGVSLEEKKIYEIYQLQKINGQWVGYSGAIFDLTTNGLRPAGWTSADAAGLPIAPGLVRYQEAAAGVINHALRCTVGKTRKAYVPPATHFASASTDPALPPMGCRLRLKAGVDISGFAPPVKAVLQALKDYGMFVADNGSPAAIFLTGTPDARWDDDVMAAMKALHAADFEVVQMDGLVTV